MEQKTILVIEDEPTINRIISKYFKRENYNVLSALDGLKGLQLFNENQIDIVCLDIMMPKINGWLVAKTIRQTSNVPIIMMSALSEEEDILKGFSLKVDDYITKPFPPSVLVAKIKSLFERIEYTESSQDISGVFDLEGINFEINSYQESAILQELLTQDELTGVANRRFLDFHITSLIKKSKDFNIGFGVLFIDIDFFKKINDTFGHNVGDTILKEMSLTIKQSLRNNDLIGRWGGEEFIAVIEVEDIQLLTIIAEKLRNIIEHKVFNDFDKPEIHITVSIGGTMYYKGEDNKSIIARADELMYESKNTGRNKSSIR